MNKIHLKRLGRRRELNRRVKCHKNKLSCAYVHPGNLIQSYKEKKVEEKQKKPWLERIFNSFAKRIK